jgi:hypothetical protein
MHRKGTQARLMCCNLRHSTITARFDESNSPLGAILLILSPGAGIFHRTKVAALCVVGTQNCRGGSNPALFPN